jgi:hypothetical protein
VGRAAKGLVRASRSSTCGQRLFPCIGPQAVTLQRESQTQAKLATSLTRLSFWQRPVRVEEEVRASSEVGPGLGHRDQMDKQQSVRVFVAVYV